MRRRQFLKSIFTGLTALGLPRSGFSKSPSIPLFNCMVAGFQYYDGPKLIEKLEPDMYLRLVREPNNIYDPKAVAVFIRNGNKLGYIPEFLNEIPAGHMDRGKKLFGRVSYSDPGAPPWNMLEITVVLS